MGQDPPRRPSQQGFHETFGHGRSAKRDSAQMDGQRASDDAAPGLKRPRTDDWPKERSPVGQRDRPKGSKPTTSVAHKDHRPNSPKQHVSSQSSKALANHLSGASVKPVLDLISKRMDWVKARRDSQWKLNEVKQKQKEHHYRPSDSARPQNQLVAQQKIHEKEYQTAIKSLEGNDDDVALALLSLLQNVSEAWAKSPDAPEATEEQAMSEAKIKAIQDNIKKDVEESLKKSMEESLKKDIGESLKKDMEESLKKEATESHRMMEDLIKWHSNKARQELAQDYEQKLQAFRITQAKEAEDRNTSFRKTLKQETEKRVTEVQDSVSRSYEARIAALEDRLSQEAENKDKIAALEIALSQEAKNKDKIAALETALAIEEQNKARITALEKSMAEKANHQARIANLDTVQLEQRQRIVELDKKVAGLEAKLEETQSEQRRALKSLIGKPQLERQLQQLSLFQDERFRTLEARMSFSTDQTPRFNELAAQVFEVTKLIAETNQQHDKSRARLSLMESTLKETKQVQDETSVHLDSLESALARSLAAQAEAKERVQELNPNTASTVSDERILEVIGHEVIRADKEMRRWVEGRFNFISARLHTYLVNQMGRGEDLDKKFDNLRALFQISETQEKPDSPKKYQSGLIAQLKNDMQLNSNATRQIKHENSLHFDGIYEQLQSLGAWQQHFNTEGIYKTIAAHITMPMSRSMARSMEHFGRQVSDMERRIAACENAMKKK
ncbi:hypothetical protein V8C35DRAFT_292639 [Trichoderma chlorosporum]